MFNPKKTGASLASLFGGGKSNPAMARRARESELSSGSDYDSDGSDGASAALTYKPVQQPRKKLQKPAAPKPVQAPANNNSTPPSQPQRPAPTNNSLAWNCTLYPYKLENGSYVPQGGGPCGCVIMGGGTSFNLLIYDQSKTTLCLLPVTVSFEYTLQENLYANFYDKEQNNWSVRFQNHNDFRNFALHISVIKFHVAVSGEEALLDTQFGDVLSGHMTPKEAGKGGVLEVGDSVNAQVSAWLLPRSSGDSPCTGLREPPLVGTGTGSAQLWKVGPNGTEPELLNGVGMGLQGMKVGEEKMMLLSPTLHSNSKINIPEDQWVIATVKIVERLKTVDAPPPVETPAKPNLPQVAPSTMNDSTDSSTNRERSDSVKDRMARIARGAGGSQTGVIAHMLAKEAPIHNQPSVQSANDTMQDATPEGQRAGIEGTVNTNPVQSTALVVHGEGGQESLTSFDSGPTSSPQEQSAYKRRPSRMPQQARRQSLSPREDEFMNASHPDISYPIQMLQMSSTSVERLVRDMEAKVDKLLRIQEDNAIGKRGPRRGNEELLTDGDDLMDRLNAYINETKKAKADAAKHLKKSNDLQVKVSELLEKNQEYVTNVIELREKHNSTLSKLSEVTEVQMNSCKEADRLREQLEKVSVSEETREAQSKEVADLKAENASLHQLIATEKAEAATKLNDALEKQTKEHEKVVGELKGKIEQLVNVAAESATPPPAPPANSKAVHENDKESDPSIQAAEDKVRKLESQLEEMKAAHEALKEKSKNAIAAVKEEASSKMLEVVQKKTQKVMGQVYKQAQAKFTEGTYDADTIMGSLKDIIQTTTRKMFA